MRVDAVELRRDARDRDRRAVNLALAALPGFTLPGDLSGSSRYFTQDITAPFVPVAGRLPVPTGPGLGVTPTPMRWPS